MSRGEAGGARGASGARAAHGARRRHRAVRTLLLAVLLATLAHPVRLEAHPLHTTFTDVRLDPAERSVQLTIRVFADDFRAAASRYARGAGAATLTPDSAMARYARARVRLVLADGRAVSLAWAGVRDEGETLQLTLRASGLRSLDGLRMGNALMLESFGDQVNIVRAADGSRRHSLLFTGRDASALKPISARL